MTLLFNGASLHRGGGLAVSHSLLASLGRRADLRVVPVFSTGGQGAAADAVTVPGRPSQDVLGLGSRRRLRALEARTRPDAVLTTFGPAYVHFTAPHVMGLADPVLLDCQPDALARLTLCERIRTRLATAYKAAWSGYADAWVVETEVAAAGLRRLLRRPDAPVYVIPNTCRDAFRTAPRRTSGFLQPSADRPLTLLALSAGYPHKNLESLPGLMAALRDLTRRPFRCLLTLPPGDPTLARVLARAHRLEVTSSLTNLGPLDLAGCIAAYDQADALVLPTLLEVFSANYPEAMAMERPIVTSDRSFARSVCREAAVYVDPLDPAAMAAAVLDLATDPERARRMVSLGRERLADFPSEATKADLFLRALEETVARCRSGGVRRGEP